MNIFSTYVKEMKMASRGFYFYIEIFVAVIALIILLVAVKENPDGKAEEYLYNEVSDEVMEAYYTDKVEKGDLNFLEETELTIKASEFTLLNKETGEETFYPMIEERTVMAETYQKLESDTGKVAGIAYTLDNEEDMIRLAYNSGDIGATTTLTDSGGFTYKYFLNGYETTRYEDILYVLHTFDNDTIDTVIEAQSIVEIGNSTEQLNNREAVVPVFIAFSGALMGFFIIMSYVFLDKSQGVIKAFAVTPASIWSYLFTKTLVLLTSVLISSTIVVVPIMKLKPNYLLFYVFLIASSFAFSSLGLLIASFFDTISKAFGVLYLIMMVFMVPAFSYYIGSFDPMWIRLLPTYPLLEGFKGIMRGDADTLYVLTYTGVFIVAGLVLLAISNVRFKKTLTV